MPALGRGRVLWKARRLHPSIRGSRLHSWLVVRDALPARRVSTKLAATVRSSGSLARPRGCMHPPCLSRRNLPRSSWGALHHVMDGAEPAWRHLAGVGFCGLGRRHSQRELPPWLPRSLVELLPFMHVDLVMSGVLYPLAQCDMLPDPIGSRQDARKGWHRARIQSIGRKTGGGHMT